MKNNAHKIVWIKLWPVAFRFKHFPVASGISFRHSSNCSLSNFDMDFSVNRRQEWEVHYELFTFGLQSSDINRVESRLSVPNSDNNCTNRNVQVHYLDFWTKTWDQTICIRSSSSSSSSSSVVVVIVVVNFMDKNIFWEANSHSANQEIPRLLQNPKAHYRVYKSPPLARILIQINPVYNFPSCFYKIHINIILPSTPRSSEWSLLVSFFYQYFVCISHLSHSCYMPRLCHPPWLDHPNNIWWNYY
jgi:hypothetical protein